MVKALWNETTLAESDQTIIMEGNHYFPPELVNWEYFKDRDYHAVYGRKGLASYYDIEIGGRMNRSADWYY